MITPQLVAEILGLAAIAAPITQAVKKRNERMKEMIAHTTICIYGREKMQKGNY